MIRWIPVIAVWVEAAGSRMPSAPTAWLRGAADPVDVLAEGHDDGRLLLTGKDRQSADMRQPRQEPDLTKIGRNRLLDEDADGETRAHDRVPRTACSLSADPLAGAGTLMALRAL